MIVRSFVVALVALAALLPLAGAAEPGDAILGKWWFPKRDGKMEIRREGDQYFGKVVAYDKPDQIDEHNPDPSLRNRPFIGIEMLSNFKHNPKDGKWAEGTIYDGESGKTYKCSMWFENNDLSRLNVRGYIGVAFLGRTEIFERVTPEEELADQEDQPADAS